MAGNDKRIVLDANILIRAVLGNKVRSLISQYADDVQFYTPSVCYEDALKYIPSLMERRNLPSEDALKVLESLISFINIINKSLYGDFADVSLQRIGRRDPDDWEIVALSLYLNCPVWTEDTDFFGIGIPTWNSENVEIFLGAK